MKFFLASVNNTAHPHWWFLVAEIFKHRWKSFIKKKNCAIWFLLYVNRVSTVRKTANVSGKSVKMANMSEKLVACNFLHPGKHSAVKWSYVKDTAISPNFSWSTCWKSKFLCEAWKIIDRNDKIINSRNSKTWEIVYRIAVYLHWKSKIKENIKILQSVF